MASSPGVIGIVFLGDLLLKRFSGGAGRVLPHESPKVQAHQQATRIHGGGGFGPLG